MKSIRSFAIQSAQALFSFSLFLLMCYLITENQWILLSLFGLNIWFLAHRLYPEKSRLVMDRLVKAVVEIATFALLILVSAGLGFLAWYLFDSVSPIWDKPLAALTLGNFVHLFFGTVGGFWAAGCSIWATVSALKRFFV